MGMMMDRHPSGYCVCDRCATRDYRESTRGSYRAREEREWREDMRDLPQGESWIGEMLEIASFSGVPAADLSYWDAMDCLEEINDDYPTPPGFNGVWSTDSAHALLMRTNDRMVRVHTSLRTLTRAAEGGRFASALVRCPKFERVIA